MSEEQTKVTAADFYIAQILDKKGSKIRDTKVHIGEFIFDYYGDLIGIYLGDGYIKMVKDDI